MTKNSQNIKRVGTVVLYMFCAFGGSQISKYILPAIPCNTTNSDRLDAMELRELYRIMLPANSLEDYQLPLGAPWDAIDVCLDYGDYDKAAFWIACSKYLFQNNDIQDQKAITLEDYIEVFESKQTIQGGKNANSQQGSAVSSADTVRILKKVAIARESGLLGEINLAPCLAVKKYGDLKKQGLIK